MSVHGDCAGKVLDALRDGTPEELQTQPEMVAFTFASLAMVETATLMAAGVDYYSAKAAVVEAHEIMGQAYRKAQQ